MDKLDAAFNFTQSVLRVRAQRQELLASNIANADTPNYKARDIDFKASLEAALAGKSSTSTLPTAKTSGQHMNGAETSNNAAFATGLPDAPLFRQTIQGSVDGNTVDMDLERNQFADNAIRYEASLTSINGQIKKMLAAIQGQ